MHWGLSRCLLVLMSLACGPMVSAQVRPAVPVRGLPPDLSEVTRHAGIIFTGRVLAVEPIHLSSSDQIAIVQVTFQVEQAVRGARTGEKLTFREWAGLWTSAERYRIGERLMLFLYSPSALGLTSPVGGPAGRFVVDRDGRIVLSEGQRQAIRRSPSPIRVDLNGAVSVRDFSRAIRRMRED